MQEPARNPVSLHDAMDRVREHWSPRVVARFDDYYLKVAKLQDALAWHAHAEEDELFLVVWGTLRMEMRDRTVLLRAGDVFVVPKGVEHNPVAVDGECHVVLVERASTLHTGGVATAKTKSIAQQLGDA